MKGTETSIAVKRYFYDHVRNLHFELYAITIDKRRAYHEFGQKKNHIYNYVARLVLERIPFEQASASVQLVIDKSKSRAEIANFNAHVITQLEGRIQPNVSIDIDHLSSHNEVALQAVDLFAWGIFRKYQMCDSAWLEVFSEKVRYEELYSK